MKLLNEYNVKKPIIILGAGGHAKVLAEVLRSTGYKILGLTDPLMKSGETKFGVVCLGDDEKLQEYSVDEIELVNGIGAIPGQHLRWELGKRLRELGYSFVTVIHPSAILSSDVKLANGAQIMAGAVLQPGVHIGCDSIVNTGVCVDHDCYIGDSCHLAPGVTLSGEVRVGDGVHVGTGACVIQDIEIGARTVIAAGSVIYNDLPADMKFIQLQQMKAELNND
jgi:sugar O-acyltransferase (sialic acid O-acetyltransferase NeuD family)